MINRETGKIPGERMNLLDFETSKKTTLQKAFKQITLI